LYNILKSGKTEYNYCKNETRNPLPPIHIKRFEKIHINYSSAGARAVAQWLPVVRSN